VSGVTWRELPADALEPPPLSVVRDAFGLLWGRMRGDDAERWCGMCGENAGDITDWPGIQRPLEVIADDPAPSSPPVEPLYDQEVRAAYLAALDAQRRAFEAQAEAWPQMVEGWREMLAGQQPPAPAPPSAPAVPPNCPNGTYHRVTFGEAPGRFYCESCDSGVSADGTQAVAMDEMDPKIRPLYLAQPGAPANTADGA
jgi:hypothetical protein